MPPLNPSPHRRSLFGLVLWGLVLAGCAHDTGGKPWVKSLEVRGVNNVSRRALSRGLAVSPAPCCGRAPRLYDELLLDADRLRVQRFYEAHGYYGTKVTMAEARPSADPLALHVVIGVDEGAPTRIGDVRVLGLGDIDSTTRKLIDDAQFGLRRGQVFQHADYIRYKEGLLGILKNNAYAWATAQGKVLVDPVRDIANIEIDFLPGPTMKVSGIEFYGVGDSSVDDNLEGLTPVETARLRRSAQTAKKIAPYLIEQVFGIQPGGPFDLSKLEEARGRVLELGIFSSVQLSYRPDPAQPDSVRVSLRMAEASLHELRLGGGIAIESQRNDVHLTLQYTKRNFFGKLRTFELRLQPAYVVVPAVWTTISRHGPAGALDLVFTQSRLRRLSRLQATLGYDLGVEYGYQYHGPRAQIAVMKLLWHDRVSMSLSYNFQFLDFFATAPEIANDAQAGAHFGYLDPYRVSWFQEALHFDWRDSRVDTRRGMQAELILEEGGVYTGSNFTYEKLRLGQRGFIPLGSRVVLANRTEVAMMWSHGDEGSPITRRLSLGGPTSHRGFTEGRLAPQLASASGPPIPIGGELSYLISAEVRVDLVKLIGSWLTAAAFVDAGDVGAGTKDTVTGFLHTPHFSAPHVAVGAGLRYRTPIGVVRADVGVRVNRVAAMEGDGTLNPDPGQRVAFHISFAEAF